MAYSKCNVESVQLLIQNGAQVDAKNENGMTLLMMAALNGQVEIVRVLLEEGANVNLKNKDGQTAQDLTSTLDEAISNDINALLLKMKNWTVVGLKMNFSHKGYKAEKEIGSGSFGKVYVYKYQKPLFTFGNVAKKDIAVKVLNSSNTYHVDRELNAISRLKHHDHVLDFYYHKEIEEKTHIYMELCKGNLTDFLNKKTLTSKQKLLIMTQIADGMQFIHKHRIIHKDLKPDNVLIKSFDSEEIVTKITDFGLAYPMLEDEHTTSLSLSFGGSRPYLAPELVQTQLSGEQTHKKGYKVDVWSFGVVFYKVLKGDYPFKYPNDTMNFMAAEEIPKDFSEFNNKHFTALLVKIFDQDPKKRPTMENVYESLCKITFE